jgi:methyl coenzyme M reductase gamma subunit
VNGFIEIYVDGWLRFRWLFTLKDYESFSFEQQVELREADLKKIIHSLKENVVPNFDPARTEFAITYQSKMNDDDQIKMPDGFPNELYNGKPEQVS